MEEIRSDLAVTEIRLVRHVGLGNRMSLGLVARRRKTQQEEETKSQAHENNNDCTFEVLLRVFGAKKGIAFRAVDSTENIV